MSEQLVACSQWLQQGDVFEVVPCPVPFDGPNGFGWSVEQLPALLITYDCQIDKRKTGRLHFTPVRPIALLESSIAGQVRRDDLAPYDAIRFINADALECYSRPSESFWLPLDELGESQFVDLDDGEPPRRCLPNANRIGTLSESHRHLLRRKLNAFWTGQAPAN